MTTTPTDPRAVFSGALARMTEAHDALVIEVTVTTLVRYQDACAAARRAFEALVLAGVERARARGFGPVRTSGIEGRP